MTETLSPRERVIRALHHQEADFVPLFVTITPQLAEGLARHLAVESYTIADSPLSQNRISYHEVLLRLGNDVVGIGACSPTGSPTRDLGGGIKTNEWRVKYREVGHYAEMVEHPLAAARSVSDVKRFPFPDPQSPGRFSLARQVAERYGSTHLVCGDLECTIFEGSWYLTGLEKFLMDLSLEEDYVFELMDRVMEYSIGVGRELLRLGAEMIWLGDDVGMQEGMLISPETWRRHLKPRMRAVIEQLKAADPEVHIAYHCCGSYAPIIPDLIEIGVDVLNALQPTARDMELGGLKERYGGQACFFGGLDTQRALPFGSEQDVEAEVRRVIRAAGSGGGLILAGAHNLQPDVSVAKVLRLYSAAHRFGRYPLAEA
jgi:uroporphyrinogen decarboxylase